MSILRAIVLFGLLTGCADAEAPSADTEAQEIEALTRRAVAAYDRQMKATCACFVAAGMYETEAACLKVLGSGASWADCGSQFLEEHDSSETRQQMDCFIASSEKQANCVESAACDTQAVGKCAQVPAACAASQPGFIQGLLERCPDLGLLSRPH